MRDNLVVHSSNSDSIENKIYTIREKQVMLDRDLAELYGVEPKRLNEQVKRNIERFPKRFRFQLSATEKNELVANCDRLESLKYSSSLPYAFTEQGVSMLSAVLRSKIAVEVSIKIIDSFVSMRKFISNNTLISNKVYMIEQKLLEHDNKFNEIFKAIETKDIRPKQGIFFDGQIFDAYVFISKLIKKAEKSIILIDDYVDETVLLQLSSEAAKNIDITILTKKLTKKLELDLKKHNAQYRPIEIKKFMLSHDRFLIIDKKEVYHIGASLKDLGKRWFAFSLLDIDTVSIIDKISKVVK
jgi:hypothetical protein